MDNKTALGQEWVTLQNNHERYEGGALLIKLVSVVLFFAGAVLGLEPWLICLVLLLIWAQEGIFKTYQARLEHRMLQIECLLAVPSDVPDPAFQLHSSWLSRRKGTVELLGEYAASACRPTVAFPHAVLVAASVMLLFMG